MTAHTPTHTPEPWELLPPESFMLTIAGSDASNRIICHIRFPSPGGEWRRITPEDTANARRIVACVNACHGIPTEWLEHPSVHYDSASARAATRCAELSGLLREVSNGLGFSESWSQRVAQALKKS